MTNAFDVIKTNERRVDSGSLNARDRFGFAEVTGFRPWIWRLGHFSLLALSVMGEPLMKFCDQHRWFGVGPWHKYRIHRRVTMRTKSAENRKTFCRWNRYWYWRLLIGSGHRAPFDEVDEHTRIVHEPDGCSSVTNRTLKTYSASWGEGQDGVIRPWVFNSVCSNINYHGPIT